MSEKIYAWLLHLYPSQFREAYGSEACNSSETASATKKDSSHACGFGLT